MASKTDRPVTKKRVRKRTARPSANSALIQFGKKFKQWMTRKELTAQVLAKMSEESGDGTIDESRLSRLLSAKGSSPTLETAEKFTKLLGLTLEEFYVDPEAPIIEKKFAKEFTAFRHLLAVADEEGLRDVLKLIQYVVTASEQRKQARARAPDLSKEESG